MPHPLLPKYKATQHDMGVYIVPRKISRGGWEASNYTWNFNDVIIEELMLGPRLNFNTLYTPKNL